MLIWLHVRISHACVRFQLCINLTNESLHNLFIEHVFKLEQETYIREEVEWHFVEYEDNQHVLDLIQKRACRASDPA